MERTVTRAENSIPANFGRWLFWDLHDNLGQKLVYIGLELSALMHQVPAEQKELKSGLKELHLLIEEATQQLSTILGTAFSQPEGEPWELQKRVRACVDSYADRTGVSTSLNIPEHFKADLEPAIGFHIEAILQEALWNAWRHARPTNVTVQLNQNNNHWLIEVTNDGSGFNPNHRKKGHYGLAIMRERAKFIGGRLSIISGRDQSTKIRLFIPKKSKKVLAIPA